MARDTISDKPTKMMVHDVCLHVESANMQITSGPRGTISDLMIFIYSADLLVISKNMSAIRNVSFGHISENLDIFLKI